MTAHVLVMPTPSVAACREMILAMLADAGLMVTEGAGADLDRADIDDFDIIAGPGTLACTGTLFDRASKLKALVSVGVGCEGFDQDEARSRSIRLFTGSSADHAGAMSSATIMLMLALCHDLPGAISAFRDGRRRSLDHVAQIDDLVVGLVGYGAIGREVARRLRAWDVRLLAYSPSLPTGLQPDGVESVSLDALLRHSDIVSLHAPLNARTAGMIDADRLARMKPGAMLVNTARGGLVDEHALAAALHCGRISGAALDCFSEEPLAADHPLRSAPNLILTPHQIGHTPSGRHGVARTFAANIIEAAAQITRPAKTPVSKVNTHGAR